MAYNFGQELSNRIHPPTDCDLDGLPLHAARNRYGHLHSLSDRDLGHNAWFRAICWGNGKPVASCSAVLDRRAHHHCDSTFRWHGGTRAGCGGAARKRSTHEPRGKPALARGVSRDITKRKIAEEELRESEERFRTVANAAPVLIWMAGPDKLCTFFNKGWLEFTGRMIDQELGFGWAEGVYVEDRQ